ARDAAEEYPDPDEQPDEDGRGDQREEPAQGERQRLLDRGSPTGILLHDDVQNGGGSDRLEDDRQQQGEQPHARHRDELTQIEHLAAADDERGGELDRDVRGEDEQVDRVERREPGEQHLQPAVEHVADRHRPQRELHLALEERSREARSDVISRVTLLKSLVAAASRFPGRTGPVLFPPPEPLPGRWTLTSPCGSRTAVGTLEASAFHPAPPDPTAPALAPRLPCAARGPRSG